MSIIYEPGGPAREYSAWAANLYRGCGNGCVYCYAPGVCRMSREKFSRPEPRKDILKKLRSSANSFQKRGISANVLLSFTSDPYQKLELQRRITCNAIEILHEHGHTITILTKNLMARRDFHLLDHADIFAMTLTLLDDDQSRLWEPKASLPADRIHALAEAHERGIQTWVSLEPVIDPEQTLEIIRRCHPFVDHWKVGRMNHIGSLPEDLMEQVEGIDWGQFVREAMSLLQDFGYQWNHIPGDHARGTYYIKSGLREAMG